MCALRINLLNNVLMKMKRKLSDYKEWRKKNPRNIHIRIRIEIHFWYVSPERTELVFFDMKKFSERYSNPQ